MGAHKVIIPLLNGKHFYFVPNKEKGQRGLDIGHIAYIVNYVAEHYKDPTPRFSHADVIRIVWRLLYKREPHQIKGTSQEPVVTARRMTFKQEVFARNYLLTRCNGAEAARIAGYSPRRAKQTAYDLLHPRRRY